MVWLTQEEICNLLLLSLWGRKPENLPNFLTEEIFPCTAVTPYFHILIVSISITNPLQLKVLVFHFLTFHICHVTGLLLSLFFLSWFHYASRPSSFVVLLHICPATDGVKGAWGLFVFSCHSTRTRNRAWFIHGRKKTLLLLLSFKSEQVAAIPLLQATRQTYLYGAWKWFPPTPIFC